MQRCCPWGVPDTRSPLRWRAYDSHSIAVLIDVNKPLKEKYMKDRIGCGVFAITAFEMRAMAPFFGTLEKSMMVKVLIFPRPSLRMVLKLAVGKLQIPIVNSQPTKLRIPRYLQSRLTIE